MRRLLLTAVLLPTITTLLMAQEGTGLRHPVRVNGYLLAPVPEDLARKLGAAQDGKASFTIAVDGAPAEALTVAPERLRDYQNVYYRVTGKRGSWRLEEQGFSPGGADEESKLIRRALGVPETQRIFFLPGREHLLAPAKSRVALRADGQTWDLRASGSPGGKPVPTRAVVLRADHPIRLTLTQAVGTRQARAGDVVSLTVDEDVVVDGRVALAKGTSGTARVLKVRRPGWLTPAALVLRLDPLEAVDGTQVALKGASGTTIRYEGRPGWLIVRAGHVELASGTVITAHTRDAAVVLAPEGGE